MGARDTLRTASLAHTRRSLPTDDGLRLAAQVLAFAESMVGRQVGDGECFALADLALHSAGARSADSFTEIGESTDYVWGRSVKLSDLRPGDILQFRDFALQSRIIRGARGDYGGPAYEESVRVDERPHHTAIVERVDGASVVILEQNVEPAGRVVQRNTLVIASGVQIMEGQDGETTVSATVQGDVRAYRPVRAAVAQGAELPPG